MKLHYLAYACAILPIVCVHLTLLLAIGFENLHGCIPYWQKCHSISATGRQYPEFFVFKAVMIPVAVMMMGYWFALSCWLKRYLSDYSLPHHPGWIMLLGVIASIAMVIYTVTLGAVGEPYALARRIGVVLFFALSAFAHLLLLRALSPLPLTAWGLKNRYNTLFKLCLLLILLGLFSALLGFFWEAYQFWDNAFEWWFALLLMGQFFVVGTLWEKTNFQLSFSTKENKTP